MYGPRTVHNVVAKLFVNLMFYLDFLLAFFVISRYLRERLYMTKRKFSTAPPSNMVNKLICALWVCGLQPPQNIVFMVRDFACIYPTFSWFDR